MNLHRISGRSGLVLLGIGLVGLVFSMFMEIPVALRYVLAGATLGVEGLAIIYERYV